MRLLVIGSWATFSTKDVDDGIVAGLVQQGHEVTLFLLAPRLQEVSRELYRRWKRSAKVVGAESPTPDLVAFHALRDLLPLALTIRPDWVVVIGGKSVHLEPITWLRKDLGMKVALLLTESPYEDQMQKPFTSYFDLAWTTERTSVAYLQAGNPTPIRYLPHSYDPARHRPWQEGDDDLTVPWREGRRHTRVRVGDLPRHDVVFVGTGFPERIEALQAVDWTGIDLGLYGHWPLLSSRSKLRRYLRGGILDNAATAALYQRARIGLNLHRSSVRMARNGLRVADAQSLNPRAYELAATGCFQISDDRAEVAELFGDSVPTFPAHRPAVLGDRVRDYLAADGVRAACARASSERVRGHTFADRAGRLVADLENFPSLKEEVCRVPMRPLVGAT